MARKHRKVDPVRSRAGKLGIEENTRRRREEREIVRVLKQDHPDLFKQIVAFLLKQNESAGKPKNPTGATVEADLGGLEGATRLTLIGSQKDPVRGGRGGSFTKEKGRQLKKRETKKESKNNNKGKVYSREERDKIWDVLVEVFKFQTVARRQQKEVGDLVTQFLEMGATDDEIRIRQKRWWDLCSEPKIKFWTARAVRDNWYKLTEDKSSGGSRIRAKPGKYDDVATIDLRGPEPHVLPPPTDALEVANADQGPDVE